MRICSIEDCNNKHHAKGYCKKHYNEFVLREKYYKMKCSVDGCNNSVSENSGRKRLCMKHFTRLKRNGDVNKTRRERPVSSILNELKSFDGDIREYNFENKNTWRILCKIYYGNKCNRCGWCEGNCEAHHIQFESKGGKNTINNCEILCPNCHSLIHTHKRYNMYSEQTIEEIKKLFSINNSDNLNFIY